MEIDKLYYEQRIISIIKRLKVNEGNYLQLHVRHQHPRNVRRYNTSISN